MIPRTTVDIGEDELNAVNRVLRSGQYVKGEECNLLEEEFSKYQNVKYGAGVNSGTSAIFLGLKSLGIKPRDEIITVPNTFAATVNSILMLGAKPVFVDIDFSTFNIDVSKIEDVISKRTKAIIPVHLYGLMSDMNPIKDIAEDNNLSILEDACQAHGAEYFSKRAGSIGDLTAFSFFPTKNVTVAGDGGIVLSNNEKLIDKIKVLRDHGRRNGKHVMIGLNNRLSEILAAIGREHLKKLDKYNDHRRKIADTYNQNLKDISEIVTPIEPKGYKHVYHLFTIKTKKRDELKKYLKENDIGTKIMYEERLNELDYVKQTAGNQPMPINDEVNQEILSLPISGTLDLEKINCVCDKIREFYN